MTNFLISDAWAQTSGGGGGLFSLLPLVLIFVVFYFLLIRPQQKRAKTLREMIKALKVGDEVASNGGLVGKIAELDDNFVTMEVASGVNVRIERQAVAKTLINDPPKKGATKAT
ncbi:MAG: preprotein translocase subunit YajC [Acidiferrobacteraceae bacterium]|nr:preprotein translocase subunit YajC [Acidiferrobacteraceae bacterium]|tara:strand:+ start:817 stop:1158 length:342 start_codon:yes stop_codon:yes gene_type:complete